MLETHTKLAKYHEPAWASERSRRQLSQAHRVALAQNFNGKPASHLMASNAIGNQTQWNMSRCVKLAACKGHLQTNFTCSHSLQFNVDFNG